MSDEEKKIEQIEEQVEGTTTAENTTINTQGVQDVEQKAEEKQVMEADEKTDEASEAGDETEKEAEDPDRGDVEAANTEELVKEEKKEEEQKEESSEDRQTSEDIQAELEELRYSRDEENALKEISQAQSNAQSEMQEFQTKVTQILEQGLKHYGIDPEKSIEDIAKEDPAKADIARELLNSAQQHIQAKQQELVQKVGEMEQNVVFNRAEREIKKFELTAEQEIEAAKMFVKIINATGVADISEDLKEKVRLAVASAKMSVPVENITAQEADTSVLETPSEKIEGKVEEETEEKSETTPEVDIDDYKESPTNTAKITVSTAPEINETNVLAKMAAMPYKDRVAFMIEHQDVVDAAMRKESARRERERRKI
jgi:hypothetical protein